MYVQGTISQQKAERFATVQHHRALHLMLIHALCAERAKKTHLTYEMEAAQSTIASSSVVIELQSNARTLSVAPVSVMSVEHFLLVTYDERIGFGMTVIWIEY